MDLRGFVGQNRPAWERLEGLLDRCRKGMSYLSPEELRELGLLHRKASTDLAAVRTIHPGSKIVAYLNDLAIRSHNVVYRMPRRKGLRILMDFARAAPAAVRRHMGALGASATIFMAGALLGAVGTSLDEEVATLVLGTGFVEEIREGEYWVQRIFDVVPHSVASAGILTNNLAVAFSVFAMGFTGLVSCQILFLNGLMLGAVLVLCGEYGLLADFVPFVITHGPIEISAIIVAGAGGFVIFDGWLHPGDRTRLQGLRHGAREGLRVAGAAIPALMVAAPVEAFVSPIRTVPAAVRITLGTLLALAFWTWLLVPERRNPSAIKPRDDRAA